MMVMIPIFLQRVKKSNILIISITVTTSFIYSIIIITIYITTIVTITTCIPWWSPSSYTTRTSVTIYIYIICIILINIYYSIICIILINIYYSIISLHIHNCHLHHLDNALHVVIIINYTILADTSLQDEEECQKWQFILTFSLFLSAPNHHILLYYFRQRSLIVWTKREATWLDTKSISWFLD